MKVRLLALLLICLAALGLAADADDFGFVPQRRKLRYVEEFYLLYTQNHMTDTDSIGRNIQYLKYALDAPFIHSIQALAEITTLEQRDQYRKLLIMRITFLLAQEYVRYGWRFDQEEVIFYNRQFRTELLGSFEYARSCYQMALQYWQETLKIARDALRVRLLVRGAVLEDIYNEARRILSGDLDYGKTINFRIRDVDVKKAKLKALP